VAVRRRHSPGERTGRHLLRSAALARALVADAGVRPGDLVVDVGAGTGVLTGALDARGARVLAVELDGALARDLRRRFAGRPVEVVHADARELRWPGEPFAVVANLPFGISTALLRRLLGDPGLRLRHAELVVEWGLAVKRTAAWPSTLLGVLWGVGFELRLVRRLPPEAFAPPPSVAAAILRASRRPEPLVPPHALPAFGALVRDGFASDAPLRRLLPPRTVKRLAHELGFAPDARARDLDAHQWAAVFRAVRPLR